jgi:hypothetical protein
MVPAVQQAAGHVCASRAMLWNRSDKPVAAPRQSLHKSGGVSRVAECLTKPFDGGVKAMLKVHEGVSGPKFPVKLFARNQLTWSHSSYRFRRLGPEAPIPDDRTTGLMRSGGAIEFSLSCRRLSKTREKKRCSDTSVRSLIVEFDWKVLTIECPDFFGYPDDFEKRPIVSGPADQILYNRTHMEKVRMTVCGLS